MSTNINITVGDNALLDRAKQQQTANRQAQLNRENSTRLEAQATDERTKAQAAAGKDANGNPLYGVPTPTPQIDRRPAANRVINNFLLLKPRAAIDPLTLQTPTEKNIGWPKYMDAPPAPPRFSFELNGGPNNSTAFVLNKTTPFSSGQITASHPSPENESRYTNQYKNITVEMFVYFGNTLPLAAPSNPSEQSRHSIEFLFGNIGYIKVNITTFSDAAGYGTAIVASARGAGDVNNDIRVSVADDVYTSNIQDYNPEDYRLLADWGQSPLQGQTWYHLALVKKDRELFFFIDGILYSQLPIDFDYIFIRPDEQVPGATESFRISVSASGAEASLGSKMHGYRFTPKALYISNFTPPPNL